MFAPRENQTDAILHSVLEGTDDMICAVDANTFSLLAYNSAIARHFLTKFGKTLRIGIRLEEVFDAENVAVWRGLFRRAIDEGPFSIAHRGLVKGQTLWLSFNRLIKDGRCFGVSSFARDITPFEQVTRAAESAEDRFAKVFRRSPCPLGISSAEHGVFLDVNDVLAESLGYERAELIGKTGVEIGLWPDNHARARFAELLRTEKRISGYAMSYRHPDGHLRHGLLACDVIRLDGEECFLVSFTDVTTLREAEQALRERERLEKEAHALRAQLEQAQRLDSLGTLAGGIAHDFNNILCSVIGYTELALLHVKDEPVRSFIQDIEQGANRAKDLVRQILAFSRQAPHETKPVQVANIVKEAVKLLRVALPSTILFEQEYQSSGCVLTDPIQIHQVMMNLGTNAGLAMHEKGGTLEVRVTDKDVDQRAAGRHPDLKPGRHLCWTVKDSGCGMTPEVLGRVFEPFFVTSEVGVGTTFEILLPLCASTDQEDAETVSGKPSGKQRVLLVDDDPSITELGRVTLASFGYQATTFTDPSEALKAFTMCPNGFDVLVTDAVMPRVTGNMLALAMRRIRPDLPMVLTSGTADRLESEESRADELRVCLQKPSRPAELAQAIQDVCGHRPLTTPRT